MPRKEPVCHKCRQPFDQDEIVYITANKYRTHERCIDARYDGYLIPSARTGDDRDAFLNRYRYMERGCETGQCAHCGRTFIGTGSYNRAYCSPECHVQDVQATAKLARLARSQARPQIACDHCGEQFIPARSDARYCSAKCRVAAHRAKG